MGSPSTSPSSGTDATRARTFPLNGSHGILGVANSPSGDSVTDRLVRILETFTPTRTAQTTADIGRRAGCRARRRIAS